MRQALRRLSATPLLSATAILTLAVGIGSAVVMVDVLDRLLLRRPRARHRPGPRGTDRTALNNRGKLEAGSC